MSTQKTLTRLIAEQHNSLLGGTGSVTRLPHSQAIISQHQAANINLIEADSTQHSWESHFHKAAQTQVMKTVFSNATDQGLIVSAGFNAQDLPQNYRDIHYA